MTSKLDTAIKSGQQLISALKKDGQPTKPKRRVRFDLSSLESTFADLSMLTHPPERVLSSGAYLVQGTKRGHSAECRSHSHSSGSKIVKNEQIRILSGSSSSTIVQIVSNEGDVFSVIKGPDFIITQRIKAYRGDKHKRSVVQQVQEQVKPQSHPSTKTKALSHKSRSLPNNLVKEKQIDFRRDAMKQKALLEKLRTGCIDLRSCPSPVPVPADLLEWRLEQVRLERRIKKFLVSSGH